MYNNFVGIDASLRTTAIVGDFQGLIESQGLLKEPKEIQSKELFNRCDWTANQIICFLKDNSLVYDANVHTTIVIEYFIMGGVGRICDLAFLSGVLHANLYEFCKYKNVSLFSCPPTSLKKYFTDSGVASKAIMVEKANRIALLRNPETEEIIDHNIADAFLLKEMAMAIKRGEAINGVIQQF